jgi:hypothetical protein
MLHSAQSKVRLLQPAPLSLSLPIKQRLVCLELDGINSALAEVDPARSSGCSLVDAMDMWLI